MQGDRPVIKGGENLLGIAEAKLHVVDLYPIRYIKDEYGKKAVLYSRFVLVAKQYVLPNNIISVNENLVLGARRSGKPILFFISSLDKFYVFTTESIIANSFKTHRGRSVMLEFNLDLGYEMDLDRSNNV